MPSALEEHNIPVLQGNVSLYLGHHQDSHTHTHTTHRNSHTHTHTRTRTHTHLTISPAGIRWEEAVQAHKVWESKQQSWTWPLTCGRSSVDKIRLFHDAAPESIQSITGSRDRLCVTQNDKEREQEREKERERERERERHRGHRERLKRGACNIQPYPVHWI